MSYTYTSKETAEHIQKVCEASNDSIGEVNQCMSAILKYMEGEVLESFGDFAEKSNDYSASFKFSSAARTESFVVTSCLLVFCSDAFALSRICFGLTL